MGRPKIPKKYERDFELVGHHRDCPLSSVGTIWVCHCNERDQEDWEAECERRYDAWKNGDYDC